MGFPNKLTWNRTINIINTPSPSRKVAMALRSTGIGLVCVISMKKMKRVCTTSLCTLCLPFFPIQSLRLKLVLYHLQFLYPTNMQYRNSHARPHLNTPNLANRLYRLRHHCHDQFSGADAATRPWSQSWDCEWWALAAVREGGWSQ